MSWKPEAIANNSGKWVGNGLRFATKVEAEAWAYDRALRWTCVKWEGGEPMTRAVESEQPANYCWFDGRLLPVKEECCG